VRYVAAGFDLQVAGLALRARFGETRLYENLSASPRAWLEPGGAPAGQPPAVVGLDEWSPERIQLQAQGPGELVLSELAYPGWRVRVDGAPAELEESLSLLRAVTLDEGVHQVVFEFRPLSLYLGLACCLAGLIFVIAHSAFGRSRSAEV